MKRSDVVKYLSQEYGRSHRGGMSEMTDEERMDFLLKKLEELGMLPPKRVHTNSDEILYSKKNYSFTWEHE